MPEVEVLATDALWVAIPGEPFKVVANLPFEKFCRDQGVFGDTAEVIETIKSVEVVDPYTVQFALKAFDPIFLMRVVGYQAGYIVSKKAVEKLGDQHKWQPVGTGPFAFERHSPRDRPREADPERPPPRDRAEHRQRRRAHARRTYRTSQPQRFRAA